MRTTAILILLVSGCTRNALSQDDSLDAGADGSPDASGDTCAQLATDVTAWYAAHQACASDPDCTFTSTRCGLPDACGGIINATGAAGLGTFLSSWDAQQCGGTGARCSCPALFPQVGCNAGVCGIKGATTCDGLRTQAQAAIDANQGCVHDSDCFTVTGSCGLPAVCGAYVNQAGKSALESIDQQYQSMQCQIGQPCPPCAFPGPAACNLGVCGRKM